MFDQDLYQMQRKLRDYQISSILYTDTIKLIQNLLGNIQNGDACEVIKVLLYKTPYYFKGIVDDAEYFNKYWEGGYQDYLDFRKAKENTGKD